jgi:hypothetical protein
MNITKKRVTWVDERRWDADRQVGGDLEPSCDTDAYIQVTHERKKEKRVKKDEKKKTKHKGEVQHHHTPPERAGKF